MKGVIFNVFEEFISVTFGEQSYEALLDACPMKDNAFVGPGSYPDSDLYALVREACDRFEISSPDALRAFGKFLFARLASKFSRFVECHDSPKSFLLSVHDVIHVEVRKLMMDARTPSFHYEDSSDPGHLVIRYSSDRQLCFLMEGLLNGVSEHYQVPIQYRQSHCMHEGADDCRFELSFGH